MKITILGPGYPYRGGPATFNSRLARQFIAEGNTVNIITFTLQYPKFLFPGKTQYSDGPPPQDIVITRELNSVNPINWIRLGYKIKKEKPDILLLRYWLPFLGPSLGTVARIARSDRHIKVISIFDNVVPHEKRVGDRLLTKFFTGSINGSIVMSSTVLDDLQSFRPDLPVMLSPHPLFDNFGTAIPRNDAAKALNLDPEFSYLLFFGFIRKYKGLDILLEALSDNRLINRKMKLLVAGEFYEDDAPYKEFVKKHSLENNVIFHDHFISDSEVPLFFSVADLVVQPYRSATQSGVTQIAYHFDKPMLVTNVGGLSEIVTDGKCGYVVKPEPVYIADAINDYFENNWKSQFTDGVRQEKEKFTWDKMTKSIIEVYNSI